MKITTMLILFGLIMAVVPSALATSWVYPTHNFGYMQPRVGAYTAQFGVNQGLYDYMTPVLGLTRYGADYNYGVNIRNAVYPQYPNARIPSLYQPYYGYPYGSYGNAGWERYKYYAYN